MVSFDVLCLFYVRVGIFSMTFSGMFMILEIAPKPENIVFRFFASFLFIAPIVGAVIR